MSKQYGLILPGQQKKLPVKEEVREFTRPSIFDESSSESDDNRPTKMQMRKAPIGPSLMECRKAKNLQEKALAEDPTIFQYDELYDKMENNREQEKQVKSKEPKKARYITKLMEAAERRKLENELRVERQVQKEREAEGEEFKDKEAFVTSAYRKKLEEMRKLEEINQRNDYLEAIGDVTKQKDLDGFYRHIYEQKLGSSKDMKEPEFREVKNTDDTVTYKPIKSGKIQQQRAYRNRKCSNDEEDREKDESMKNVQDKKIHLTNNIDADSDFSIDDSSTESENEAKETRKEMKKSETTKDLKQDSSHDSKITSNTIALNLESLKPKELPDSKCVISDDTLTTASAENELDKLSPPRPKRNKVEIWRKRTVGDVFLAAVKRYHERKAARNRA